MAILNGQKIDIHITSHNLFGSISEVTSATRGILPGIFPKTSSLASPNCITTITMVMICNDSIVSIVWYSMWLYYYVLLIYKLHQTANRNHAVGLPSKCPARICLIFQMGNLGSRFREYACCFFFLMPLFEEIKVQ